MRGDSPASDSPTSHRASSHVQSWQIEQEHQVMRFNPHNNVTADGKLITEGLLVITNELNVGKVTKDSTSESMCCDTNDSTKQHVHPAQFSVSGTVFSDHTEAAKVAADGCYCRHDHWFTVETPNGSKSFNGERFATVFEGKSAASWQERGH